MWRYSALLGGGSGGTPTPTPTREQLTFGAYGLSPVTVTGGNGVLGSAVDLATSTTDALDGLFLSLSSGAGRIFRIAITVNGVSVITNYPVNLAANSGNALRYIPISIPAGASVQIAAATNAASLTFNVLPLGYKSNVASNVSSIAVPAGSTTATINGMGANATLNGAAFTAWTQIGTSALSSAAKGLASVHLYTGNVSSARTACDVTYEVGYGPDSSNVTQIGPSMQCASSATVMFSQDADPIWAAIPAGNFIFYRAKSSVTPNTNPVSCQTSIMY